MSKPRWSLSFGLLAYSALISGLGDGVRFAALPLLAASITHSALLVAAVTTAGQLPLLLVGPVAGVLADRADRQRLLRRTATVQAVIMAAFAGLVFARAASIPVILVAAFLLASTETLSFNVQAAVVPDLVESTELARANSIIQGAQFVASDLVGIAVGAVLFTIRRALPFLTDAVSFAIAAVLLAGVRLPRRQPAAEPMTARSVAADIGAGLGWLWRNPMLRSLCAVTALANFVVVSVLAIAVLFALDVLRVTPVVYGLLMVVVAVGGVAGLLAAPKLAEVLGNGRALQLTFLLAPIPTLVAGLTSTPLVAAAALFFVSASVSIGNVVSVSVRQAAIPTDLFGRVNSSFRLLATGLGPVAGVVSGLVAGSLGLRAPFLIGAGLFACSAVLALAYLSNEAVQATQAGAAEAAGTAAQPAGRPAPGPATPEGTGEVPPEGRLVHRATVTVAAAGLSAALVAVLAVGAGPVPALGRALDPQHGVWTSGADGVLPRSQVLRLAGLRRPVRITFTRAGIASVTAQSQHDLYLALGYVHARFRLTQMDLERRLGAGRLAQLVGGGALASDRFELRLGLLRTAEAEWAATPRRSPAWEAVTGYTAGVNDWLAQARAAGRWPALYSLAGVYPAAWSPVDSLVVQEVLTQSLDFTTTPLDYAIIERSLGAQRTRQWFPVQPPNAQSPYDPGPYRNLGVAPLAAANANAAAPGSLTASARAAGGALAHTMTTAPARISRHTAIAAAALLAQVRGLPRGEIHQFPDSNSWAANGPSVGSGVSMLAGDPHLAQTLPAYWYDVALAAPGLQVTGASLPGVPGIVIGHDAHIAWSLTDVGNTATLFYAEKTSRNRPGQYFWRGAWHRMQQVHYMIPVHGSGQVNLTVDLTVHGPVLTQEGQTTSVDWMGDYPSPDLAVLQRINTAANCTDFKNALKSWYAPSQNFVCSDDRGNIGIVSAGYYPLVARGAEWLPLPGTGPSDVTGTIPFAAIPQVYDPPGHFVATANQRPVGPGYPYYIGTALDYDYGYRADQLVSDLHGRRSMTPADFGALQSNVTDHLATLIVPRLLTALAGYRLTPVERAAQQQLGGWNYAMGVRSPAAAIWWTFWSDYLAAVFKPWWAAAHVPVHLHPAGLAVSTGLSTLDDDLEAWTLHDPANPAFSTPGGTARTAPAVMRAAFATALSHLQHRLGPRPQTWAWGRLHSRQFPSLTQAPALGYGPRSASGDPWTLDAADGGMVSSFGPSWRMIVSWAGAAAPVAEGVYPGGQSENPASPWYQNLIAAWWTGRYLPLPVPGQRPGGSIVWTLQPGRGAR